MITEEHTDAHKGVVWPTSSFESELWTVLLIGKKKNMLCNFTESSVSWTKGCERRGEEGTQLGHGKGGEECKE